MENNLKIPISGIYENRIFERNFFNHELANLNREKIDSRTVFSRLSELHSDIFRHMDESQLEMTVIRPVLDLLGWSYIYQKSFMVQGREIRPDFVLFATGEDRDLFLKAPSDNKPLEKITAVWENKAEDVKLDNGKARNNPYFQLLNYLVTLRLPYGFLSNGREFILVDNSQIFTSKRYVKLDLARLLNNNNESDLRVFFTLFGKNSFCASALAKTEIETIKEANNKRIRASDNDLRNAIYGTNGYESMFEKCGAFIHERLKMDGREIDLTALYQNCLYFTFRLLFIAFLEDRHADILENHSGYAPVSLASLRARLETAPPDEYTGWDDLQKLFETLDKGNPNRNIPLFNGGLFNVLLAPFLNEPRLLTNGQLKILLDMIYFYQDGTGEWRRDFSSLSVIEFGRIYEGLLEFEFRLAKGGLWHVEYQESKSGDNSDKNRKYSADGYFDQYDFEKLKKSRTFKLQNEPVLYRDGSLYLTGGKNSRKQSASYYTPQSLSGPLVKKAIAKALENMKPEDSILDLKILDNACGSGHLLVESLNVLTEEALKRLDTDPRLAEALVEEKERIKKTLDHLGLDQDRDVDELDALKRILLKHVIYGVDIQPFAIELAKLSLWIETFMFGAPLSFIEHHLKAGNSLAGVRLNEVEKALTRGSRGDLFDQGIKASLQELKEAFKKLNNLRDTTAEDIIKSKRIYSELKPGLDRMNHYFNLINHVEILKAESEALLSLSGAEEGEGKENSRMLAEKKKAAAARFNGAFLQNAQKIHDRSRNWAELEKSLASLQKRYRLFNWDLEFPEVFSRRDNPGFNIIIGNPPWDKTKFDDRDFFSSYRSNYRGMSNSEKAETRLELLGDSEISKRYHAQKRQIAALNEYYSAKFPYNRGAGDGNLFRFFVENSLGLLARDGVLNYIIPTSLFTDEGSTALRKHIWTSYNPQFFYGFENREGLFPDVHLCYKFGLMSIENRKIGQGEKSVDCRFYLTSPASLNEGGFAYDFEIIKRTSPDYWAFMEISGKAELGILSKIYDGRFSRLSPDWLDFRNELHATNDKEIFRENKPDNALPLYKGSCVWQYDSRYWARTGNDLNRNEYWLERDEFDRHLLKKERGRLIEDIAESLPRTSRKNRIALALDALGLEREEELDAYIRPDREFYRLAFRAIARDTDERTLIFSVIPPGIGAQNSLWTSVPKRYFLDSRSLKTEETGLVRLLFAQAVFNSLVLDWIARGSIAINVNKTYIYRLPLPQPDDDEIFAVPDYLRLARNSLRLSHYYNGEAFQDFLKKFDIGEKDIIRTRKQADMARVENDLIVAKLYGLTKPDLTLITDSFRVMNRQHPEYRATLLEAASRIMA